MSVTRGAAGVLLALGCTLTPPALAADGVIEINQARVDAGGLSPGDFPGSPAYISASGSYRLSSNLLATRIQFSTSDVTLDLNGFTIDGAGTSVGGAAFGGISGGSGAVVRNGVVRNFNGKCVNLGDRARVIDVTTEGCTEGIEVGRHSLVLRSTARGSTGVAGIVAEADSVIVESLAEGISGRGIDADDRSVLAGNLARGNEGVGLAVGTESVLIDTVSLGNHFGISVGARSVVADSISSDSTIGYGISAQADSVLSANETASNTQDGTSCRERCAVSRTTSGLNDRSGIVVRDGSTVVDSVASDNGIHGIDCGLSTTQICGVVASTAVSNDSFGLRLGISTIDGTFNQCTLNSNGTDVSTGRDPGFLNTCSGTTPCP